MAVYNSYWKEMKSTLFKSLIYNRLSTNQIKCWFLVRGENRSTRGKTSHSREPTNSIHVWRRVRKSNPDHIGGRQVLSPLGQPCHHTSMLSLFSTRKNYIEYLTRIETQRVYIIYKLVWKDRRVPIVLYCISAQPSLAMYIVKSTLFSRHFSYE